MWDTLLTISVALAYPKTTALSCVRYGDYTATWFIEVHHAEE
jgi:hypothetical protein